MSFFQYYEEVLLQGIDGDSSIYVLFFYVATNNVYFVESKKKFPFILKIFVMYRKM